VLAPHFTPSITSGQRYYHIWMLSEMVLLMWLGEREKEVLV
jgi:hypothetical protein